jgi:hypothetical protein
MAHGYSIAHSNGLELERHTTSRSYSSLYRLADPVKVDVAWYELVPRVHHPHKGALYLLIGQSSGLEKSPVRRTLWAHFGYIATHLTTSMKPVHFLFKYLLIPFATF